MKGLRPWAGALALASAAAAVAAEAPKPAADTATPAALADLGLALLRQPGPPNAVVSPVAVAAALGMVHAGLNGPAEAEIEALFAPRVGGRPAAALKQRLPALLQQLRAGPDTPFVMAGRVWMDLGVAPAVPPAYLKRMATRYAADAARVPFARSEEARALINGWTAEHTAGRITELLPPGSVTPDTRITLTTALHFKSPWLRPFDPARTAPAPFGPAGAAREVPTMAEVRTVAQAQVDGALVMALPFVNESWQLLLAVPAEDGGSLEALAAGLSGQRLAAWRAALKPERCAFSLPRFEMTPQATSVRAALEAAGMKTGFTPQADLRPMLGRRAANTHLQDVIHAAGIRIDETGGEAVAAVAATVQSKSFTLAPKPCAVDRPFLFAVLHAPSGTPLFIGRLSEPAATSP